MQPIKQIRIAVGLVLTAFGWLAITGPALAQSAYGPRIVHLSVVDRETGEVKRVYLHDRRYFVAAQTGNRYSLRIENVTGERVLVVLSVDGVNVVSGETANFNQRGYILSPHESADINGWRKSENEIAAFRFAPLPQSYAARTGRASDVGVIGMAVFRERRLPRPPVIMQDRRRYDAAPPPPPPSAPMAGSGKSDAAPRAQDSTNEANMNMARRSEKLGTAHGEIEQSYAPTAPFVRASANPVSVRVVEYDSSQNLIAAGVIAPSYEPPHPPRPFPANRGREGYVPDPPAYGRD